MTKLVAIDMDGTLLDSCKQMPSDTVKILSGLMDRGIRIAIASGRQRMGLEQDFAPIADRLIFICENGGCIYHRGSLLDSKPIALAALRSALQSVRVIENHYPVFCGLKSAYMEDADPELGEIAGKFYPVMTPVENLESVAEEDAICKIAVFNTHDEEKTEEELLRATVKKLRVVSSSKGWVDISRPDCNKGEAVRFLQNYFGIAPSECMAFGDYYNDLEMMESVGESYAMANAVPEIKAASKHTCLSNDEHGVLKILKHL